MVDWENDDTTVRRWSSVLACAGWVLSSSLECVGEEGKPAMFFSDMV